MGKRKQSTPQRSLKTPAAAADAGLEPVSVENSSKRPKKHLDVAVEEKLESVESVELNSSQDVEIGEVFLLNPSSRLSEEDGEVGVRLQYMNSSKRGFGQLTIEAVNVEVFEGDTILSGKLDGPENVFSSLVYLVKKQFVGLSCLADRIRIFITNKFFLACETEPGITLRKHVQNLVGWLRPELSLDAFYGAIEEASNQREVFDPSNFYNAIKRTRDEPRLNVAFDELLPELRPYQQQAVYWMVQREKGIIDIGLQDRKHPLWVSVGCLDRNWCSFYYNIFSGMVSRKPQICYKYISGGILADEMGLGKTIEVLACILANKYQGDPQLGVASQRLQKDLDARKRDRIECICGEDSSDGMMVQCDYCDVWQHVACIEYTPVPKRQSRKTRKELVWEDDSVFACGGCKEVIASVEVEGLCGATLIVCPSSILKQWQDEIIRHTKENALKVLVYEGVQRGCIALGDAGSTLKIVGAHDLAAADIVLTTYDVLRTDLFHDVEDENQRSMRFQKKYHVIATPLTRLQWWRVCLDEAQMVENNTARATDMAMRLQAQHKWCVTGTPIQRGLDDLYGLLKFLRAEPFDNYSWWTQAIKQPYEEGKSGAISFAHAFFRDFMWRSMKHEVLDQLNIPPQEEQVTWLKFSCIESHFYRQQHENCSKKARDVIQKCSASDNQPLNHIDAAKLMNPLLRLRQACCHPQVGSAGIRSLQGKPMTMDEILEVLIEKAKTEGEEAQRSLVGALNGLAALSVIENQIPMAVSLYREALAATEENANSIRVDPLQKLHTLFNLAHLLERQAQGDTIPRTLRDGLLLHQCEEIRSKYMSTRRTKLVAMQHEFYTANKKVSDFQFESKSSRWANWWLDAFSDVQQSKEQSKELVSRIKNSLSGLSRNASSLALRFRDINGLKFLIQRELDAIDDKRAVLLDCLIEMDKTMDNPLPDDVKRVGQCSQCQPISTVITCAHCDMEILFQAYSNRLLYLKTSATETDGIVSAEEALAAQQRVLANKRVGKGQETEGSRTKNSAADAQVLNRPSESEQILSMLFTYVKPELGEDDIEHAKKHLEYLEALRNEYAAARSLATAQRAVLTALDELNMSITRLSLHSPEDKDDDDSPFSVHEFEIPQKNADLTADKFIASDKLTQVKGQLRYLKGLAQARKKASSNPQDSSLEPQDCTTEDSCPICHERLEAEMMVLPCGHLLCCKCMVLVVDRTQAPPNGAHLKRIACPTCRQRTYVSDVALANNDMNRGNSEIALTALNNVEEKKDDEESLINISGSYGTKIEALVRRILAIKLKDPAAKVLVFSSWQDVLDVVQHALTANQIRFGRSKSGRKMHSALSRFKNNNDVQVLLLPIQHGANGLNIVEAQHVILVEPLLNPAAEAQAINRVHRIGQRSKTLVHRFIIRDTVEENIYRLSQRRSNHLPMKQKEQPLTISDMNDLLAWDEPKNSESNKDGVSSPSLRDLPPSEAAALAAEARLKQSLSTQVPQSTLIQSS